ncbi:MAG: glycosyltransferase family 4 protein [Chloroflexota bacterium]
MAAIVTHPVQYYSPLFQYIEQYTDIDLTVYYGTDAGSREFYDSGFATHLKWDVPLLHGYKHLVVSPGSAITDPIRGRSVPLAASLRRFNPDAIWIQGYSRALHWAAFLWAGASRTPILLRGDSNIVARRKRWRLMLKYPMLRTLVAMSRGCLYVGTRNREYYQHYGAREEQLFPVPFVVDNDFFSRADAGLRSRRDEARSRFGIQDDAPVIVAAGKLSPAKAPLDLLDAFARIRSSLPCHLLYAGDGPLRSTIETTCKIRGIPNVHITGFLNQSEIPQAYVAGDLQVLPSSIEPWGLVVNEGMNFGLPVVVSEAVGCAPDLVLHDVNGYTFKTGDVTVLADRLGTLVANPGKRAELGRASRGIIAGWGLREAAVGLRAAVVASTRHAGTETDVA